MVESSLALPGALRRTFCLLAALVLIAGAVTAPGAFAADKAGAQKPLWGAIAARQGAHGYAFNQPSRATAERLARAQCERAVGSRRAAGRCEVRAYFDRRCGALATGNFGEWATGLAGDAKAAGATAVAACDAHLPTEPCKLAVSVCSLP